MILQKRVFKVKASVPKSAPQCSCSVGAPGKMCAVPHPVDKCPLGSPSPRCLRDTASSASHRWGNPEPAPQCSCPGCQARHCNVPTSTHYPHKSHYTRVLWSSAHFSVPTATALPPAPLCLLLALHPRQPHRICYGT